jgi:hypothetical protein
MTNFYNNLKTKVLLSLFIVFISLSGYCATYYVSNTGSDSNSGLTTSLAWKTLAKVNATGFKPGDLILFKSGETFVGQLNIPTSGIAGNPITFGKYGTGVNPVINANYANNACILTNGRSYVTIDGIDCKNGKTYGIGASSSPGTNITVKNLTVSNIGNTNAESIGIYQQGGYLTVDHCTVTRIAQAGIIFGGSRNAITNNNVSYTNLYSTAWGAGINGLGSYTDVSYNTVDNCGGVGEFGKTHGMYLHLDINSHIHHNTVTNSTTGSGIKVLGSGNYHHNKISGSSHAGISAGMNGANENGTVNIYYNIFTGNREAISETNQGTGSYSLNIYNNTCYQNNSTLADNYYSEISINDNVSTSLVIKNNILYGAGRYTFAINTAQTHAIINNNCIYQPSGNLIYYAGSAKTWTNWKALGFDTNGINANPLLESPKTNFQLQSTSPAINKGVSVGLTTDYNGDPIVGLPDMGAFENGLKSANLSESVLVPTGIEDITNEVKIDVYPNPSIGRITVRFSSLPNAGSKIDILDISGKKVASRFITESAEVFDLADQPAGLYLVKAILGTNETIQKLILNK